MNTEHILRKIQRPVLWMSVLHRETLISTLTNAIRPPDSHRGSPYKVILLCAPAGYGKTTLIVDSLQQLSINCFWYMCERSDTPALFMSALLLCIRQYFPTFGSHLDELFARLDSHTEDQENWEFVLESLFDALHNEISQQFVLVLDSYQKVSQSETMSRLVNQLIERFPPNGVLIIESRCLPNLELATLIAQRQLFGLGSSKLRFSPQELYDLAHLQNLTDFSLQDAEYLTNAFEGWIAGILLGSGLGYTQLDPLVPSPKRKWGIHAFLTDRQQLTKYITSEVFSHELATYEFLKAVSIFDRLTPEYCNELLQINDAAAQLVYAEQQGLLVIRTESPGDQDRSGVYICHPILREILTEELRQRSFDLYLALHRQAFHILQKHQDYEAALRHALLAQEYSQAISIIVLLSPGRIGQGDEKTISRWLEMLPEQILQQDPWLLLLQVNIDLVKNEYARVPSILTTIETLLEADSSKQDSDSKNLLRIELKLARSKYLSYQGEFQAAQELCRRALDMLPEEEYFLRTRVHHRLGICLIVGSGQLREGIVQLRHALQLSDKLKDERQTATLYRLLASAYSWAGNYKLSDYHQVRALQTWERLNEPWEITNSLTGMGLLKLRQGLIEQAEKTLFKALHFARDIYRFPSGESYALVALGELFCTQARYIDSLAHLEEGLRLAYQCGDRYLINCALCSLATTSLFMEEITLGEFFLNQVVFKEQVVQNYEGILYRLTQGMIFMAQEKYDLAQQSLAQAVTLAKQTSIQFLWMRSLLLLALCYLRQQKVSEASQLINQAMLLNKKGDFDYDLKVELDRYPELQEYLERANPPQEASFPPGIAVSAPTPVSVSVTGFQPPASKLRIRGFGDPEVRIDDAPITRWHMTRSMELFFLLLEKPHPLTKEQIIDALWPDALDKQIDTIMRTSIYYLRRTIGKESVVYRSGFYKLDLSSMYVGQIWYDVALFEEQYKQAKIAMNEHNYEGADKAFTNMIELYGGNYLHPFYNDWCISRRDQLRQAYMEAHQQLAMIAWQENHWEKSLKHWRDLLSMDICSEDAHYGIMRCYMQQGKRKLALKQYRDCCQILQETLQIAPGPAMFNLYKELTRMHT